MTPLRPPRVDYDAIAHLYDEPFRDHVADPLLAEGLARRAGRAPPDVAVLDIGCGTGKQVAANRTVHPDFVHVGLDRFAAMLRRAKARCASAHWVQGDGAQLPFRDASFDHVTTQYSYQHVRDPERLVAGARRILRPGGRFVMTNIDPWGMEDWAVYRYFPESLELDHADFVPVERFVGLMKDAGFDEIAAERSRTTQSTDLREVLAFADARHRSSQFLAISDDAYEAGIRRLREEVARAGDEPLPLESGFCLVTVRGTG